MFYDKIARIDKWIGGRVGVWGCLSINHAVNTVVECEMGRG